MSDVTSTASTAHNEPPPQAEIVSLHQARANSSKNSIHALPDAEPAANPDHSWGEDALETPGYDVSRFYTEASYGGAGHTTHSHAMPSQLAYEVDALIQSGRYPWYRTRSDFHRDADYHRLKWLNDNEGIRPETESVLSAIALEQALLEERNHLTTMKRVLKEATETAEEAIEEGDIPSLERFIAKSNQYASKLDYPYHDRYMDIVERVEKTLVAMRHERRRQHSKDTPIEPAHPDA